jgi:hypothetical protein
MTKLTHLSMCHILYKYNLYIYIIYDYIYYMYIKVLDTLEKGCLFLSKYLIIILLMRYLVCLYFLGVVWTVRCVLRGVSCPKARERFCRQMI